MKTRNPTQGDTGILIVSLIILLWRQTQLDRYSGALMFYVKCLLSNIKGEGDTACE